MAPFQSTPSPPPLQMPSRRKSDGGLSLRNSQQQRDALEIEQMRKQLIDREALANSVRAYKEHALRPGSRRAVASFGPMGILTPTSEIWSVMGGDDSPKHD